MSSPLYTPHPKQEEALRLLGITPTGIELHAPVEELLFGGAAGGGKSLSLRLIGVMLCLIWPKSVVPIFRRTYPELESTHIRAIQDEIPPEIAKYNREKHELRFPNGSILEFRYCETDADVNRYQSAEWSALLIDEATHMTEYQLRYLRSRVRSTKKNWRRIIVYATNPGNRSHSYFLEGFVDRSPPGTAFIAPRSDGGIKRCFLPALLQDNPSLDAEEYGRVLEGLGDEALVEALLKGNWHIFEGMFFSMWRPDLHVVDDFLPPSDWTTRVLGVDFGYGAPWACLWLARNEPLYRREGLSQWVAYRELYGPGVSDVEQAKLIAMHRMVDWEQAPQATFAVVADPAMFAKKPMQTESVAEVYAQNGVSLAPGSNERVLGWQRVRQYLIPQADGKPSLTFMKQCRNAIRTFPQMTFSSLNREDIEKNSDDHLADSLRYALSRIGPVEHRNHVAYTSDYEPGQPVGKERPLVDDLFTPPPAAPEARPTRAH